MAKLTYRFDRSSYIEFVDEEVAEQWGQLHYRDWAKEYKRNMHFLSKLMDNTGFVAIELQESLA